MKKILTMMLCLTLCIAGVCSCGNDEETKAETETKKVETFSKTYTAEDADLSLAPDVILEPEQAPYNLGGWLFFNTVAFELDLPQEDTYTFTIEYSRPGETGDALGSAYMAREDEDDFKMAELTFKPTSKEDGDWSVYQTLEFTETLPEGQTILFIEPDELPEGCDHFINLRQITVKGTKPYDGADAEDENKKETHAKKEKGKGKHTAFDGWWTLSPNYYEDVIPLVSTFYVDAEEETWTVYDAMGEPGDTMSCSFPDKYTIILDMEGLGEQIMVLEGDTLFYTDDGHEAYVKVDDPQFVEAGSYAGTWQFMGDPSHGIYYELTDSHAKKTGGDSEADTDYTVGVSGTGLSGGTLDTDITYLDLPYPASPLYPVGDGNALIEKDVFRNNIYIRDGSGLNPAYSVALDQLVNTTFVADDGNGGASYHNMTFYPYSAFHIYKMIQDDEGYYTQDTSADEVAGLWSFDANLNLVLTYEDGSQETFNLNNWDGTLNLGQTGQQFMADSYFPY